MAKKKGDGGPNKSKLIREYMKDHPGEGPSAVAEAINAQHGLSISAQYVSTVKSTSGKKGSGKKVGRPPASASGASGSKDYLSSLLQAKKLAEAMGGVTEAKEALDALAKLGL